MHTQQRGAGQYHSNEAVVAVAQNRELLLLEVDGRELHMHRIEGQMRCINARSLRRGGITDKGGQADKDRAIARKTSCLKVTGTPLLNSNCTVPISIVTFPEACTRTCTWSHATG